MQELSHPPLDDDSSTLSQMLTRDSKTPKISFSYPSGSTSSSAIDQGMELPRRSKTPVSFSTPSHLRPIRMSGTKSLGMKRRLKSVENSTSGLGMKTNLGSLLNNPYSPAKKMRNDTQLGSSPSLLGRTNINNNNRCNSAPVIKTFSRIGRSKKSLHPKQFTSPSTKKQEQQTSVPIQQPANENIPSFVGFQTAHNKPIEVSSKAKKMAERLFSQIDKEIDEEKESNLQKQMQRTAFAGPMAPKICQEKPSLLHENSPNSDQYISCESGVSEIPCKNSVIETVSNCTELENDGAKEMIQEKDSKLPSRSSGDNMNALGNEISAEESSLDEALLGSFESSEHLETTQVCHSPILMAKQQNRRKNREGRVKVDSNVESFIPVDPTSDKPCEVQDLSVLSDDFELEMLAVDLTSKFEQVSNEGNKGLCERKCVNVNTRQQLETYSSNLSCVKETNGNLDKSLSCRTGNDADMKKKETSSLSQVPTSDLDVDDQMLLEVGAVFDEDWKCSQDSKTEEVEEQKLGFITASQKPIKMSACAMKRAEEMMKIINEENSMNTQPITANSDRKLSYINGDTLLGKFDKSSTSKDVCTRRLLEDDSLDEKQNFIGFQTASNKPVVISEAALRKANQLLNDDEVSSCQATDAENEGHFFKTHSTLPSAVSPGKLTNLFRSGSNVGRKENKNFKAPRRQRNLEGISEKFEKGADCWDTTGKTAHVLGTKNLAESQIIVSDESLVKAAEILEDMFT